MSFISLIAAIDENRGLGQNNHLLCHLSADLKRFKELTLGKPVIMGRKTYDSIGKPLQGRLNIVLSKRKFTIDGVTLVGSLREALQLTHRAPEVMIIGGAEVFKESMPLARRMYLTLIHHQFDADVFFPLLDKETWQCQEAIYRPRDEKNDYDMTFYQYDRWRSI